MSKFLYEVNDEVNQNSNKIIIYPSSHWLSWWGLWRDMDPGWGNLLSRMAVCIQDADNHTLWTMQRWHLAHPSVCHCRKRPVHLGRRYKLHTHPEEANETPNPGGVMRPCSPLSRPANRWSSWNARLCYSGHSPSTPCVYIIYLPAEYTWIHVS